MADEHASPPPSAPVDSALPPAPPLAPLLAPEEMRQITEDAANSAQIRDQGQPIAGGPLESAMMDGVRPPRSSPNAGTDIDEVFAGVTPMTDVRATAQPLKSHEEGPDAVRPDRGGAGQSAKGLPMSAKGSLLKSIAAISKMSRAAQRRILPAVAAQTQTRLTRVNSVRQQKKKERTSKIKSLSRMAKPTAIILVVILIGIAGVVDLLDIIKEPIAEIPFVGWLVNALLGVIKAVVIGVPTFFMARKVQRISKAAARVVSYGETLAREAMIGLRRVTPLAQEMKRTSTLRGADPNEDEASLKQFVLYKSRILLNQAVTQLLEALPLADLGPWQTFRVIRAYRDQQVEYRKLRAAVVSCQLLSDKLDVQARIEIEYLTLCLRLLQQLIVRASRRGAGGLIADASDVARRLVFNRSANPVERAGFAPPQGLQPRFVT